MSIGFPLSLSEQIGAESEALAQRVRQSVVQIRSRAGGGSGMSWGAAGRVITNHHVVPRDGVEVVDWNGRTYQGTVVKRDPANDLAEIQLESPLTSAPALPAGDSQALRVGQLVFAIGHPFGIRGALTAGIVSSSRPADGNRELVVADIQLRPGNSGGPLFDVAGRVVGVNAMIARPGVAMAVPSHVVRRFTGEQGAPKLGIVARDVAVSPSVARLDEQRGVMLYEVKPGSVADEAGFIPGDIVVALNERTVHRAADLANRLAWRDPAAPLAVRVLRGGQVHELAVAPAVARAA